MEKPHKVGPARFRMVALLTVAMAALAMVGALSGWPNVIIAALAGLAALLAMSGISRPAILADPLPTVSASVERPAALSMEPPVWLEALPMEAVLIDSVRQITATNRSARNAFPGIAVGAPLALALRHPDILSAVERTLADGETREVSWVERAYRVWISRLERSALLVFENQEALLKTERMRVDFIANASHELRTPLASLLGFIETLQGPARNDEAARKRFLAIMQEQALRMSRLVNDLLSLSRIEQRAHEVPSERIDLRTVIEETLDASKLRAAEGGMVVVYDRPATAFTVLGDRDELLRLVENLFENALKYGRSGNRVVLGLERDGANAVFSVRDFGPGIPEEHLPRLTERFYRVDAGKSRESGGTGLGLALVKHIVQRHRGKLAIANAEGGGALFRVSLPAA